MKSIEELRGELSNYLAERFVGVKLNHEGQQAIVAAIHEWAHEKERLGEIPVEPLPQFEVSVDPSDPSRLIITEAHRG